MANTCINCRANDTYLSCACLFQAPMAVFFILCQVPVSESDLWLYRLSSHPPSSTLTIALMTKLSFTEHLPCTNHCARRFTCMGSQNLCNILEREASMFLYFVDEKTGSENEVILPQVTQPASGRAMFKSQDYLFQRPCAAHHGTLLLQSKKGSLKISAFQNAWTFVRIWKKIIYGPVLEELILYLGKQSNSHCQPIFI